MSRSDMKSILLIGPPNVGKSVLFNHFTGLEVSCANYSGTTVEYSSGQLQQSDKKILLIDVPGTYSLEASNEAEQVAVDMLKGVTARDSRLASCCEGTHQHPDTPPPAAVLCVLDAVHLESSLYLLSFVMDYSLPVVAALNRVDIARRKGIEIDTALLAEKLGIPVVETIAPTGEGTEALLDEMKQAVTSTRSGNHPRPSAERWKDAEELVRELSRPQSVRPADRLTRQLISPWPGIPIALFVLAVSFGLVVGIGMGIRQVLLLPLFRGIIFPLITTGVETVVPPGIFRNILIGEYGFLIKGLEWPLTLVFPYILSFYAAMALMEDSGYLPRLGALLDGLFTRFGVSGGSIIPLLLGYGCAIPAILATRALNTRKERLIIVTVICLTIPCISQTGAIITLLAEHSLLTALALILTGFSVALITGLVLNRLLTGAPPAMVLELPELLFPRPAVLGKKVLIRIKRFLKDEVLPMAGAVGIASVLYESGIMNIIGKFLSPLVTGWLRLPEEAAIPLVLGIMRRELSILPLLEMELTALQLFTGALVGLFYVPCIAVVVSVAKEFRLRTALIILVGTSASAFFLGGLSARIGSIF